MDHAGRPTEAARRQALRALAAVAGHALDTWRRVAGLCSALAREARPSRDTALESACAVLLLVGGAWASTQAWRFYDTQLRPLARAPAAAPRVYGVRADDPAAVRRYQAAMDALGEATTDWEGKRPEWARAALERALALDPENPDARALRRRMEIEPAPTVTPAEQAARDRDGQVAGLVGAANAFFDADLPEQACALLAQAQAAAPAHPLVVEAAERAVDCRSAAAAGPGPAATEGVP